MCRTRVDSNRRQRHYINNGRLPTRYWPMYSKAEEEGSISFAVAKARTNSRRTGSTTLFALVVEEHTEDLSTIKNETKIKLGVEAACGVLRVVIEGGKRR